MFLNQRGAEFSFFYTKRSSSTYTFKLTRWDEKAGLQRDAIRSQCLTCSRHKKGDRR